MTDFDGGYKRLFAHPRMVEDLLRGFVREPWIDQLDFSTLERCEGSYISEGYRRFEQDMVWRVRWRRPTSEAPKEAAETASGDRSSWLYVYLLLEFQSRVERFMAVRVLSYVSLFYQDLVSRRELTPSEKLPPVLPIVLYNGPQRWWAARQVSELIEDVPGGLAAYRPSLRYLLLDEGAYSTSELDAVHNLAAGLFRLEHSREVGEIREVVDSLATSLREPAENALRRAFGAWLHEALLAARFSKGEVPESRQLEDTQAMLRDTVIEWTREWKREGQEVGRLEGERQLLLRLMERKFGPLDSATQGRVHDADESQLLEWGESLLSAKRLDEVFSVS